MRASRLPAHHQESRCLHQFQWIRCAVSYSGSKKYNVHRLYLSQSPYGSTGYGCQSCSWWAKQKTGKIISCLFSFAPENLVAWDGFGRPVTRLLTPFSPPGCSGSCSWVSLLLLAFRDGVDLYSQPPFRTDFVYYREAAGTRPIVLKVARVTQRLLPMFRKPYGPISVHPSFPTPVITGNTV